MSKPRLNCAIYTRKSSDEGLEQSFNSLDAQREACEAYIVSQKHEGWHALPTLYDDGGFSGGNMDRPALQKLLGDIQAGKINIVIVYKVDRLTRALSDFAKIVEQFDRQGVSFVSVTQAFNTTSSMGRLTLNVLLSFAQFEREVTGERIRDKIAASKKKGMWMGGVVPLGYAAKERTLVPVPEEVKIVRHIFERYLALGSVRELQAELKRDNIFGKPRIPRKGQKIKGPNLGRGALYGILQNPLYIGQIRHRDKIHPGLHKAIISEEIWQAVEKRLTNNRVDHPGHANTGPSLLTGFLFSPSGEKLTPTSSAKGDKRYRYYISTGDTNLRLPAGELEDLVLNKLRDHLQNQISVDAEEFMQALNSDDDATKRAVIIRLVEKITVHASRILVQLKDDDCLSIDYCFSMPGLHRHLVADPKLGAASENQKQTLLKAFLQGYVWRKKIFEGKALDAASIARTENKNERYVARMITFGLLAPDLVVRILKGDVPAHVISESFTRDLPISWFDQRARFSELKKDRFVF